MGKSRSRKHRGRKLNPTGLQDTKQALEELANNGAGDCPTPQLGKTKRCTEDSLAHIADQLQSSKVEDRLCGFHSLASLSTQQDALDAITSHSLIKICGPLMVDSTPIIRHTATGALRNLSTAGDHSVCDAMVEQDVMTPLIALLKQYGDQWTPSRPADTSSHMDTRTETFVHAIHLLWNICESNSTAVRIFNREEMIHVILHSLDLSIFPDDVIIAAGQCLQTVSEENSEVLRVVRGQVSVVEALERREGKDVVSLLIRVLALVIRMNLNHGRLTHSIPSLVPQLIGVLHDALNPDHRAAAAELSSHLSLTEDGNESAFTKSLQQLDCLLTAQQLALEMLTNLCCNDDDGDEWEEDTSSSDNSDEIFSDITPGDVTMEGEEWRLSDKFTSSISAELHEAMVSTHLVEKTIQKARQPAENVCQLLKEDRRCTTVVRKLHTLQCRALLCLSNLMSNLDVKDLGGPQHIHDIWNSLGKLVFQNTDSSDTVLLEAATSAMRAVLQRLSEIKTDLFKDLTREDLQLMFAGAQNCTDVGVRANLVKIVGMMGCLLVTDFTETSTELAKSIGVFLLNVCVRESEVWVVAEALDNLFDVFSEDDTDDMCASIGLVTRLQQVLPSLKHKINQARRTLGAHYPIVVTAKTNLIRFIRYKSERLKKRIT